MKKISVILLIIISIMITGCSKEDIQNVTQKEDKIKYDDVKLDKDNIEFKGIVLDNGKVLIHAKNNNKDNKEIRFVINFLNKDKEKTSTVKTVVYSIASNKDSYVLIDDSPKDFASYEIVPTIYDTSLVNVDNEVSSSSEDVSKGVKVSINNKSKYKIGVDVGVVYYDKDNNIVGYEYDAGEITANNKKDFTILHPYDRNYDVVSYDHYKEVINQSYSLNK